jgi:2-polyprenyl-6-methoxyphenol hydroxylase-like FAD-dependent oxidoreductase
VATQRNGSLDQVKVVIVGAGIGGVTAALALRRRGAEVVVCEKAHDLRHIQLGGGIHMWPNGLRALDDVGIAEQLRETIPPEAVMLESRFETFRGRRIATMPLQEETAGLPSLAVVRGHLHAMLVDALGEDAIRLGSSVAGFEQTGDGIAALLEDGGEENADILLGADGLHSAVRQALVKDGPPRSAGYTTWTAVTPFEHPAAPPGIFRVLFGRGGRFVLYPVGGGRVYWEGIHAEPPRGSDPPGGHVKAALDRFGSWVEPVAALVSATRDDGIVRADVYDRPPAKQWGAGRATLLGDAAHPMTNAVGQGANQAIEDAIVLARCLARNGDLRQGLREYEGLRQSRTASFVRLSHMLARLATLRNPLACTVRDRSLQLLFPRMLAKQRQELAYDARAV